MQLLNSMASLIELIGTKASMTMIVKSAQEVVAFVEITALWLEDNQVAVPAVSHTLKAAKKLLDTIMKVTEAGRIWHNELFEDQVLISPCIVRIESSAKVKPPLQSQCRRHP